jgi:hypothetical protein
MATRIWGRLEICLDNEEDEDEMAFTAGEAKEKDVCQSTRRT